MKFGVILIIKALIFYLIHYYKSKLFFVEKKGRIEEIGRKVFER